MNKNTLVREMAYSQRDVGVKDWSDLSPTTWVRGTLAQIIKETKKLHGASLCCVASGRKFLVIDRDGEIRYFDDRVEATFYFRLVA